jgi:ABC-type Fe3+/spermidine/putrescine transport system ATPase subunit
LSSSPGSRRSGAGAPILSLQGLVKRFGTVTAVDHLSLELQEGEFLTLLGPSGCGKTTALRVVAGFERPDAGTLTFQGEDVTEWNPQRRGFGMVFQNYALFPHLDVAENVAFGLKSRRRPREEIGERVEAALERVSLPGLGSRAVQALSGGQQQRVALARALAIEPPLLLLDEPFSNLDAALRERTRTELRLLVKELGITALFVTHDQEEAFDLSDRIAVMDGGKLRQVGTPEELYRNPTHRFVAGFVGRINALKGVLEEGGGGAQWVRLDAGPRWSLPPGPELPAGQGGHPGGQTRDPGQGRHPGPCELLVRPEDLNFVEAGTAESLPGRIRDRRFLGAYTLYFVDTDATGILEVVSRESGPAEGEAVGIAPALGAGLHVFPGVGAA